MTQAAAGFDRYAAMIAGMIARVPAFSSPASESDRAIQVDRGNLFPSLLLDSSINPTPFVDRIIATSPIDQQVAIIDATGHQRPAYRGLMVYSLLQSYRIVEERLPDKQLMQWNLSLRNWCHHLELILTGINWLAGAIPADRGSEATEACWIALAIHMAGQVLGRDQWTNLAADVFGKLERSQTKAGTFLTPGRSDNPETHWYHELVLLHAAASYAIQAGNRSLIQATMKNAAFHQNETQPDHATTQPWGLFAFIMNSDTRPLADQMLHSVQTQHPQGVSGVSRILLGDALFCLKKCRKSDLFV